MYLRKAMTQDVLGAVFSMDQPVANKWIHLYQSTGVGRSWRAAFSGKRALEAVSDESSQTPSVDDPASHRFFSGWCRADFKDVEAQQAYYSGKKKQHTVKNNILINADSKVVFLTPSYEGRIHDKRIADMAGYSPPPGSVLYQDTGFQGFTCPDSRSFNRKRS